VRRLWWLGALVGCTTGSDTGPWVTLDAVPAPGDWSIAGPGGPGVSFSDSDLNVPCAWLNGNKDSAEHHNLVTMHDGYLLFPWAPEDGGGGITFFNFDDPCNPTKVGEVWADHMRESHTLATGQVGGREYLAVDYHVSEEVGGIGFFDITEPEDPRWVSSLELPGYHYPDAYFRVALSTTWIGDRLYVPAGLLGVFSIDVSDPLAPSVIGTVPETGHVVGTFHVIGHLALSSSAGIARILTYDIGDPDDWETLSDQQVETEDDPLDNFYFANIGGEYALFARKDGAGGPNVYDLRDRSGPTFAGTLEAPEGDGGYVFRHGDLLFQGESSYGALYDFPSPDAISERARFELEGDLDTVTPIGNVAVVSVDEKGDPGKATGIYPWATAPDTDPPSVKMTVPADGEAWAPLSGTVGLSLDEMVEPRSVHAGSFRVWSEHGDAIPGRFYVMEAVTNFVPDAPLAEDTTYWVEVPAGGIADTSGNPTDETLRFGFSTGAEVIPWPE